MPNALLMLAACGLACLGATIAHADAGAAVDVDQGPSSAVVALHTAASATMSDLTSRAADLPGRAHLGGLRLGASARTGLLRALPNELLDPMRGAHDTASGWYANTRQVVHAASTMRDWVARAGGVRAATGFVLDAAAAGAVGVFALLWALRVLIRSGGWIRPRASHRESPFDRGGR